jgi:hypothetical protein
MFGMSLDLPRFVTENDAAIVNEFDIELKDYTRGGQIGIYLMTNAADIYTKEELAPICDRITGMAGFVSRWINDLHRLHVLTKLPNDTYSVNKHISMVVKSRPVRR